MLQRPAFLTNSRLGLVGLAALLVAAGLGAVPPRPEGPRPMPGGSMPGGFSRPVSPAPSTVAPSRGPVSGQASRPMPSQGIQTARPTNLPLVLPRPLPRCTAMPNPDFWRSRDIFKEIQWMARRGNIPVIPMGEDVATFQGNSYFPAGWIAYGFRVPAGESLKVSLDHPNRGWFRLMMVNHWGSLEEGMLQNVVHTFEPVVTYKNPTKGSRAVYVIVDDPGWMSTARYPFTMTVSRSWDPAQKKIDSTPIVTGIWAEKKEEPKPAAEPAPPVKS